MELHPIAATLGSAALFGMGTLMGSYLKQKGQNIATREDIEEITDRVESVRREHATEMEQLRTELAKTIYVHRAQIELELDAYRAVWRKLVTAQRATASLRPMLDFRPEDEGEEERRQRRLDRYSEAFQECVDAVDEWRPFYPPRIYEELNELLTTYRNEAVDYAQGPGPGGGDAEYWKRAQENIEEISERIDRVCEAIRERIQSLTVVYE